MKEEGFSEDIRAEYKELITEMVSKGIPVQEAEAGDVIILDSVPDKQNSSAIRLKVLAPFRPLLQNTQSDLNNASLVLQMDYGKASFLFTGDIGQEAQRKLLEEGALQDIDVLKVPHHGSKYFLPGFFAEIHPKIAVISVGAHNNFGHPASEILNVLEAQETKVYRTDSDGAVIINVGRRGIKISTGRGGR